MSSIQDIQTDCRSVRTYAFLIGSGTNENGINLEGIGQVLTMFIKCAQDDAEVCDRDRIVVTVAQYAKEGIRKVFHSEDVADAGCSVINLDTQGTPVAPFKALEEMLLWIEERKKDYRNHGQCYYPFRIVCLPNEYTQSADDHRLFNSLLLKSMEMRESIVVSVLKIDNSQGISKLHVVGKDKQTWFPAENLYQYTKIGAV